MLVEDQGLLQLCAPFWQQVPEELLTSLVRAPGLVSDPVVSQQAPCLLSLRAASVCLQLSVAPGNNFVRQRRLGQRACWCVTCTTLPSTRLPLEAVREVARAHKPTSSSPAKGKLNGAANQTHPTWIQPKRLTVALRVVLLGVHIASERTSLKTWPEEWEERPAETGYNYGYGGGEEQPAGPSRRSSCC